MTLYKIITFCKCICTSEVGSGGLMDCYVDAAEIDWAVDQQTSGLQSDALLFRENRMKLLAPKMNIFRQDPAAKDNIHLHVPH